MPAYDHAFTAFRLSLNRADRCSSGYLSTKRDADKQLLKYFSMEGMFMARNIKAKLEGSSKPRTPHMKTTVIETYGVPHTGCTFAREAGNARSRPIAKRNRLKTK